MVLYLQEYQQQSPRFGHLLNYYEKLPEYLHEISIEEIMKHINRNGVRSWYLQQRAVLDYFQWLYKTYGINLAEKYFELKQMYKDKSYVGFYNLKELKQGIEDGLIKAESENSTALPDYSGLKAIFFLEWYGVLPQSAITIQLTDVSDDGKTVYVPAENRTINIDDEGVADYFAEYKQKTGYRRPPYNKEAAYTQSTFYRNTSNKGEKITQKTIYNIRQKFIRACGDLRFEKKRVYYSGRYFEMIKAEMNLGREFSASDSESCEMIQKIFNKKITFTIAIDTLREYRVFKDEYIERM